MRWAKRILVFLAVIFVAAGVYAFLTVRSSYPQLNGELEVAVLDDEVTVHRDSFGVPHIYANTSADLFRAQGYVEAQDRFFQMDFWRHIGTARLSEMFGESQMETDKFLRSFAFESLARTELERMSEESRQILEWYAEGVNAYLDEHGGSSLSLEYAILPLQSPGYEPEPWEPAHTLVWAKVMSWDLSGNFRNEIARVLLEDDLSNEQVDQLYPPYPAERPVIAPAELRDAGPVSTTQFSPAMLAAVRSAVDGYQLIDAVTGGGFEGIGSNNWVVNGSLTETGAPILANDPHLGIQMPSIWYEVGLHCIEVGDLCPFQVVGFSFAGTPGIVIGHNANIAWGVTNQSTDTQDLYIERINPENPNQYEVDGAWVDMEVRTEMLEIAGSEPVEYEVRTTRHGPIISGLFAPADDLESVDTGYPDDYAVALAWQTLEPSTLVEAIIGVNKASNWEEFRSALSMWDIAAQNIVYADVEGNIGYQSTGEVPIRPSHDGLRPVAGWDSADDWAGTVPFEEMPFTYNPDRGYIVTANQPVLEPGSLPEIGIDAAYGHRAARIEQMIVERAPLSVSSTREMQMDNEDGGALDLVPHLLQITSGDGRVVEMQGLIERWSAGLRAFQANPGSAGAAAYQATWRQVLALTFHDDLPEDYWPAGGGRWFQVVANLLEDYDDPFWDSRSSPETENASQILELAMARAHNELSGLLGESPDGWMWGELHIARFENQSLGQSGIGPIEWLFNRTAPSRLGGGPSIVNAVGWNAAEGYTVDWVPSMRMVVDLGDLSRSTSIHTTGQSGHAFHAHYADMIEMWADGNQHPMLWDRGQVEEAAANTLLLLPTLSR
ncbi:MAG: penicillin acylase family protein [Acidimicrobiia bacterium]